MSESISQPVDEEAWLYESKDDSADTNLPPGTGDDEDTAAQSQETNGDDSQEEPLTLIEDPAAEKASGDGADDENDGEVEEGEEEDDDDEDDIEITIGDTKAVPAAPSTAFPAAPVNINIKKTIATTAVSSSAPGGQLIKAPHKGLDIDAVASINGTNIYEFNIDSLEEKPWRKPGADITDYFNYGFTEDTWKIYCDRQRRLRGDNNSTQGVKSLINQVVTSNPPYEKPYRTSFQPRSEPKEFRKSGTIDVIGGANSRRHEEALPPMMPPLSDMPFPPGLPPGFDPHGGMPPHHGMPPPHAIPPPPPPFDPRFPPPTMDMPPFDPYGGPPPHPVVSGDFHRPDDRPPMMPEDLDYTDRRRHHRSRDDREERDYRDDRDRRHRSDRGERDDRRDREREDRDSRRDRDKDRDRDRDHRDMGESRHRSSRKSRRHDDEDEDRRQKHKRSKRDDDN